MQLVYSDDSSHSDLVGRVHEVWNSFFWWSKCRSIENLLLKLWRLVEEAVHRLWCLEGVKR